MQFKVPKFLEREARIVGPLSFKQLGLFGGAAMILVILYFALPVALFLPLCFLVGGGAVSLVFVKIEGTPLVEIIPKYFSFFGSAKTYLWQKRQTFTPVKLVRKKEKEEEKPEEGLLKLSPKSKLRNLASKLERGQG